MSQRSAGSCTRSNAFTAELFFILIESVIFDVCKKLGSTKGQVADRPWPSWHCRILLKGKSIRRSVAKDVPCSKSACMYLSSLHLNGVVYFQGSLCAHFERFPLLSQAQPMYLSR